MIYISGPITGIPDLNREAFSLAAYFLLDKHLPENIIDPHYLDHSANESWEDHMRTDIAALVKCDSIYMLKGWEKSRGAVVEYFIACNLGMTIIYE